jgi:hypothetical protein
MPNELSLLVDEGIALEKQMKSDKKKLDSIKATLTKVAYEQMDNKSLKFMQIFGTGGGHFNVAYKEKFEVDNYVSLIEILGEIAASKIVRKEEIKYDVEDRFKAALIAVLKQEYSKDVSLETVLQGLGLDQKAIKVAQKKLKGDYIKDKKTLVGFGVCGECEEELYAIKLYKNFELVDRFFGGLTAEQIELVKKAIFVEDGISAGFEYQEEI